MNVSMKMQGKILYHQIHPLKLLASWSPYFHNGSASTLNDVVSFYGSRFNIKLSTQDKADLATFLAGQ